MPRYILTQIIIPIVLIFLSPYFVSAANSRPFWTEKSTFVEGDVLFAVGISSCVDSIEKGRQIAFENGKVELLNFAQLADIGGIEVETQMTYDEINPDGKFNVFRLLRVDINKLNEVRAEINKKTEIKYKNIIEIQNEEIEKATKYLKEMKNNERELEKIEENFNRISNNIFDITTKAKKYIRKGMTESEVISLLGKPRSESGYPAIGQPFWSYGSIWVIFNGNVVECLNEKNKFCSY